MDNISKLAYFSKLVTSIYSDPKFVQLNYQQTHILATKMVLDCKEEEVTQEEFQKCITSGLRPFATQANFIKRGLTSFPFSAHLLGYAVDFDLDVIGKSNEKMGEHLSKYRGVHVYCKEYDDRFIHLDFAPIFGPIIFPQSAFGNVLPPEEASLRDEIMGYWS